MRVHHGCMQRHGACSHGARGGGGGGVKFDPSNSLALRQATGHAREYGYPTGAAWHALGLPGYPAALVAKLVKSVVIMQTNP